MKAKTVNGKKQEARTKHRNRLPPPQVRGLGAYSPELRDLQGPTDPSRVVLIPIDRIYIPAHIKERPLDHAKVETYAAGLGTGGIVNPITVLPKPDDRYELETGRHRLEAHRLKGYTHVPALVQQDDDPARAAFRRNVENLHRRDYRPYEQAQGFQEMLDAKWSLDDLAQTLAVPVATIRARLRLLALPPMIGQRIGEPGFPLSHAEVLLKLAGHPQLLEAGAKAVGELDFDQRPLTLHGFQEAVEKELRKARLVKDLETYQVRELAQKYPAFGKQVRRLPSIKWGGRWAKTLCIDPKAYRKVVAPFQAQAKEDRAKEAAKEARRRKRQGQPATEEDYQERQRRQEFVQAFIEHEHAQRMAKAAKACLGLDDRLIGLIALDAINALAGRGEPEREGVLLADAIGLPAADLVDLLYAEDEDLSEKRGQLVERLLANPDRLPLARFLTVATLLRLESRWGPEWSGVAKDWLGVDGKDMQTRAEAVYKAWAEAGGTAALPGQQSIDADLSDASAIEVQPHEEQAAAA